MARGDCTSFNVELKKKRSMLSYTWLLAMLARQAARVTYFSTLVVCVGNLNAEYRIDNIVGVTDLWCFTEPPIQMVLDQSAR